eukprot:4059936-Amphidinium_carterae.1
MPTNQDTKTLQNNAFWALEDAFEKIDSCCCCRWCQVVSKNLEVSCDDVQECWSPTPSPPDR